MQGVREMDQEAPVLADNLICLSQEAQLASVPKSKDGGPEVQHLDALWTSIGKTWNVHENHSLEKHAHT